jgi:hypothetical protein
MITNVRRASRQEIKCILFSVVISAAVATIFNVFFVLTSTNLTDEGGNDENKAKQRSITHGPWPRVVSDESVACRLYDLPLIRGVSNLPRLPPLKSEKASGRPWVRIVGNVAELARNMDFENTSVVCSFEGTVPNLNYYCFAGSSSLLLFVRFCFFCIQCKQWLSMCHDAVVVPPVYRQRAGK